ncbi:lasso peptide biosynthesis B2 protein [Butyrivibrio sp. XPD2006]|uniref:lasso peptide biosynthesis B2 protein n=1 Tax=Butyrivibrio sp. XPD2006 TaxID=1280668 RepID=UPI0004276F2E|nr:lasso peptide biosynthesis B2 protein [Butyrivibrio sp. XPD2006]
MSKIEKKMGVRGVESTSEETRENLNYAKLVAFHANRVTEHMPWEAKCLTRSLTIARLLKEKGIDSTIYMGVAKEKGTMKAHSWIRCGKMYLTDPIMDQYVPVATFKYCK